MLNKTIARRAVLTSLGQVATFGSLAAALPSLARAAEQAAAASAPMKVCLTMLYPAGEGLTFDTAGFRDRHLIILRNIYGPSVTRVELRTPVPPPAPPAPPPVAEGEEAPPAPPPPPAPPLLAAVSLWLGSDLGDFIKRAQTGARIVSNDMANITRSAPIVQYDVIEGQAGEAPNSVLGGSTVVSNYFFDKEDGTWNAEFFGKAYLEKLTAAYGPALQRVEVQRGELAQGGGKPLVKGAIHLYVKDLAAYDAAVASEAAVALGAEAQQNSSLNPVTLLMNVVATS